ncbi:MAG TPA: hypothetical protein VI277_03825 [Candidatus Limnocylindria bacterium]
MWEDLIDWLGSLGAEYGVDPVVYAVLYVGAAPFFFFSLAWLIRRLRRHEAWGLAAVSTAFFFILPTLYVALAGRNLPWWTWALLIGLTVFGAVLAISRIRRELRSPD